MAIGEWGSETRTAKTVKDAGAIKQISIVSNWGLFPLGNSWSQCRTCTSSYLNYKEETGTFTYHLPSAIGCRRS